jgi:hypothetical protein
MKHVFFSLVIICGFCVSSYAQDDKTVSNQPVSPELAAIQTANSLAKYGYSNYSASALIGAAEILGKVQTRELKAESVEKGETAENAGIKTDKPEFTPTRLLADAKEFAAAAGDATLLAWTEKVEKSLGDKTTRRAEGGPKYTKDQVSANSTDSYTVRFRAGELAEIVLSGDGDTDLDLYVYDANGNLIAKDDDYSDDCYVSWVPKWTGAFTVKVKNRGSVYNRYTLVTN